MSTQRTTNLEKNPFNRTALNQELNKYIHLVIMLLCFDKHLNTLSFTVLLINAQLVGFKSDCRIFTIKKFVLGGGFNQ